MLEISSQFYCSITHAWQWLLCFKGELRENLRALHAIPVVVKFTPVAFADIFLTYSKCYDFHLYPIFRLCFRVIYVKRAFDKQLIVAAIIYVISSPSMELTLSRWRGLSTKKFQPVHQQVELVGAMQLRPIRTNRSA